MKRNLVLRLSLLANAGLMGLTTLFAARSAPERLSQLQAVLDAGSAAIAQARPSFDGFYTSLTNAQQQEVDGWLSQWREHRYDGQEYE